MTIPSSFFGQLGAELQTLRGLEAIHEWVSRVSGASTYFRDKINAAYDNTIQKEDDAETESKDSLSDSIQGGLVTQHTSRYSDFQSYFFALMDLVLNPSASDKAAGAISYVYDEFLAAQGEIRISDRQGRWGALRREMLADALNIIRNKFTFGGFTAKLNNIGVLSSSGIDGEDHTLTGQFVFEVSSDIVGAEDISVLLNFTTPLIGNVPSRTPDRVIRVGKAFEDGKTGLKITLNLGALSETGDDGNIFSATAVTSRSEADSAKGKHFFEVERLAVGGAGPHFRVRWFRSGSLLTSDLVTSIDVIGETGTVAIALTGAFTTITSTFDKAAAVIKLPLVTNKDSDIVFDLKIPRIGDRWTLDVTNTEDGNFATKIARRDPASFPSGPAKPGAAAVAALAGAGAGNVDNGTHTWVVAFVEGSKDSGKSASSNILTVVDKTVDGKVNLTAVATGPVGTTARKIYRTIAGNTGAHKFVGIINDNVTTTFQDNVADANLGVAATTEISDTLAASVPMT